MSKEQQAQPQVAIPLPKAKKNLVQIGCICMMLSVAMYGLVFATLTAPILEKVDAMGYVGLFSIVGAIGVSIMTPIGGKLGDLIGRRNIVVIPGIICALAGFAFAFVRSLIPLMILRLIVSLAQAHLQQHHTLSQVLSMKEKMYQRQWVCLQPQSLLVDLEEVSSQVF